MPAGRRLPAARHPFLRTSWLAGTMPPAVQTGLAARVARQRQRPPAMGQLGLERAWRRRVLQGLLQMSQSCPQRRQCQPRTALACSLLVRRRLPAERADVSAHSLQLLMAWTQGRQVQAAAAAAVQCGAPAAMRAAHVTARLHGRRRAGSMAVSARRLLAALPLIRHPQRWTSSSQQTCWHLRPMADQAESPCPVFCLAWQWRQHPAATPPRWQLWQLPPQRQAQASGRWIQQLASWMHPWRCVRLAGCQLKHLQNLLLEEPRWRHRKLPARRCLQLRTRAPLLPRLSARSRQRQRQQSALFATTAHALSMPAMLVALAAIHRLAQQR